MTATVGASRAGAARHVDALTGVRGVAAAWVMLFHLYLACGRPALAIPYTGLDVGILASAGWLGVDVFFALSGFVLAWQFLGQCDTGRVPFRGAHFWPDWRGFMARRTLRVFPAYLLCLSILLPLAWLHVYGTPPATGSVLLHLAMLHGFWWQFDINGVFWSLPIEWEFYLAFPLLALLLRRDVRWLVGFALLVSLGFKAWSYSKGWIGGEGSHFPFHIDRFVAGMVGAVVARRVAPRKGTWCAYVGLAGVLAYASYAGSRQLISWTPDLHPFLRDACLDLALPALFIGAASDGNAVARALATAPMRWLGDISYSVYLFHYPILFACFGLLPVDMPLAAKGTTVIVVALVASTLSYRLVERPFVLATGARTRRLLGIAAWIAAIACGAAWFAMHR